MREWAPENEAEDRVLLTGEYTPFNILAQRDATGRQLTGMIDFGDAMVGPRAYDFLGPSMFSCAGEPLLVAALLRGYFGETHAMNRQTRMPRERAASFEALAKLIWPSDDEAHLSSEVL